MQLWKFLMPSSNGFTLKNVAHAVIDKISGAPPRPVRAAKYVATHARLGDPEDVLRTIDRYAREERWLMNVGPDKGPLFEELAARIPANEKALELGAYCAYSSIMLAQILGSEASITSIEIDQDCVDSARANVEVAGLSDTIEFVHGSSTEVLTTLEGRFDLVFLDHWKDLYKSDLQLMEKRGIVSSGTVVVADNVGEIFSPDNYLNYVRNSGRYDCEHREAKIEYTNVADAVEISIHL